MKKRFLFTLAFLAISINLASAAVITKLKSRTELLITYSGNDIKKYTVLHNAIVRAGSSIKSKCYQIQTTDEFGAPKFEERCAIILKDGENIQFNSKGNILRFKESELTSILRESLRHTDSFVGKISVYKKRRTCTVVNSNPHCRYVFLPIVTHVSLLRASGVTAGSYFCIDKKYEEKNLTALRGCYFIPSKKGNLRGLKIELEKPSCNINIEGEFVTFLKSGETDINRYKTQYISRSKKYALRLIGDTPKRKIDSLDLYNFRLSSYEFYGRGLKEGDITCEFKKSQDPLSVYFNIACTNNSDIDRYIGKNYRDGSAITIKACNYFAD